MLTHHRRQSRSLLTLATAAAIAGGALVGVPAAQAASPTTGTVTLQPRADAYIEKQAPTRTTGSSTKLVAAATSTMTKRALLRFDAPVIPSGATVTKAELKLSSSRTQPAEIDVTSLGAASWDESTVAWCTAPALASPITRVRPAAGSTSFSVDVTAVVTKSAPLNFAVSVPSGVSEILSKESGAATAPQLVVSYEVPAPPPPAAPAADTLFGTNVFPVGSQSYTDALAQQDAKYGRMEATRVFYSGLPGAWSGPAGVSGRPVVVSFKANPQDITSGRLDAHFKDWFAKAPRDRQVNWTYYHEPEDNVERGEFTAAQFRAAFAHLDRLADSVRNPQLKTTPVLMCWTLDPQSRRNWRDFYPGKSVVDELGWDCYNLPVDKGVFTSPSALFTPIKTVSEAEGKPWGLAEFGSLMSPTDPTGVQRAAWLRSSAEWLEANGAAWAMYFDCTVGGDFRLLDAPSSAAWKWVVSGR